MSMSRYNRNRKLFGTCVKTIATAYTKIDNRYEKQLLKAALEVLLAFSPVNSDHTGYRKIAARAKRGK